MFMNPLYFNYKVIHSNFHCCCYRLQYSSDTEILPPPAVLRENCNGDGIVNVGQIIYPHVLLWNPVVQLLSCCDSLKVCPVDNCAGILYLHEWSSGTSSGKQPRIVHDVNYIVLLVGAIYQCNGDPQHTVYSTDSQIIKQLDPIWVPFHLLHRSGFTRSFVNSVINLVSEGLPLQAIERHIRSQREEHVKEIEKKFTSAYKDICDKNSIYHFLDLISKPIPSNDIIARCFIIRFQQDESLYSSYMTRMKVSNCIRLDHTFKVASNIGYLRADKKWVTLYGSIFIALNKVGQVIAWQFTKSTSLDEVRSLLLMLKERITDIEKQNFTIYVDNCCQCAAKLKGIFGDDITVKLDIFHAVQRVTRTLSKKHILFLPCINGFKMTFRSSADI